MWIDALLKTSWARPSLRLLSCRRLDYLAPAPLSNHLSQVRALRLMYKDEYVNLQLPVLVERVLTCKHRLHHPGARMTRRRRGSLHRIYAIRAQNVLFPRIDHKIGRALTCWGRWVLSGRNSLNAGTRKGRVLLLF